VLATRRSGPQALRRNPRYGKYNHGKPGVRPYSPAYYAAFVLDPDGNNVEAVFHGPADRSATSVKITFG
jgi:hypothetical protein